MFALVAGGGIILAIGLFKYNTVCVKVAPQLITRADQ